MNPSFSFPAGANSSDTIIGGVHFNLKTLRHWNYTLYANETLSNETNCWLVFEPWTPPLLLSNGTFINSTSCFVPIMPLRAQGTTGIVFGLLFAASVVFTLVNLRKHGRSFLAREKRWSVVGRRWQWYWMLFVATCGIISTMTGIDVDRDYLQSTALMLRSFFYTMMFPGIIACLWEATRHWNSWQERQLCDADPFALHPHDLRCKKEFYMPLLFYLFDWLLFFMTIPRPWTAIQKQRSVHQTETVAKPMATDTRFKAGAILACCALIVVCYCLRHTMYYYNRLASNRPSVLREFTGHVPPKLLLGLFIVAVRIGYAAASAWHWSISPYRADVSNGWLYGLGYSPSLLLLIVFNVFGFVDENDDRLLLSQRARRNESADRELGITRASIKPSWWSKSHTKGGASAEEMFRGIAFEHSQNSTAILSSNLDDEHSGNWWWHRKDDEDHQSSREQAASDMPSSTLAYGSSMLESASSTTGIRSNRESSVTGSDHSMISWQTRPQIVRSMLDV